mmetsp:Transcript_122243/g.345613  ORF Transcript_122243/g.345613 Transcript_122243/m.345613 type:complete len:256 (+) Transcript_122243:797-1564(+)
MPAARAAGAKSLAVLHRSVSSQTSTYGTLALIASSRTAGRLTPWNGPAVWTTRSQPRPKALRMDAESARSSGTKSGMGPTQSRRSRHRATKSSWLALLRPATATRSSGNPSSAASRCSHLAVLPPTRPLPPTTSTESDPSLAALPSASPTPPAAYAETLGCLRGLRRTATVTTEKAPSASGCGADLGGAPRRRRGHGANAAALRGPAASGQRCNVDAWRLSATPTSLRDAHARSPGKLSKGPSFIASRRKDGCPC